MKLEKWVKHLIKYYSFKCFKFEVFYPIGKLKVNFLILYMIKYIRF